MEYFQTICRKEYLMPGMTGYAWLVLLGIGLMNDIVQRYPGLRAMSLFQIVPNALKATPLGRLPLIGWLLEKTDTPEPEPPKPGLIGLDPPAKP